LHLPGDSWRNDKNGAEIEKLEWIVWFSKEDDNSGTSLKFALTLHYFAVEKEELNFQERRH
jgi:hypothetical protein